MSLKPDLFEGVRFDFTKPLNQKFYLSHSVAMGNVEIPTGNPNQIVKIPQSTYEFGANLIDARYAKGRVTILTSNNSVHDLKDLASGRLYSRFVEMCNLVHLNAEDYREKGKREVEINIPTVDRPQGRSYGSH